jgi:hypothetical protein
VFENDGGGRYTLGPWALPPLPSRGLAWGDYDNDGRIDLLVTVIDGSPALLHNETEPSGAGLVVRLVGVQSAREGLGAIVTLETSSGKQRREAKTSGSHASAQDSRVHFGLGSARTEAIEVQWPSGLRDRVKPEPGALHLAIMEGVGVTHSAAPPSGSRARP